jgi:demethylmenaquinone methyltransferase/2-methoxy-6-polyprenyl-1,4-benzoquinol methylase
MNMQNFNRTYAKNYDLLVWVYRLIGVRDGYYRRQAVESLDLKPGDTVVDLACGTGLNFSLLEKAVKIPGRIIGVDISDAMLDQARKRIHHAGWRNVDLIQISMSNYDFPPGIGGILCTNAINMVADYDPIIRRGAAALRRAGCMALLDVKQADHPPRWMDFFPNWKRHPFGYSEIFLDRHPWKSVEKYLTKIRYQEYYFGYMYLSVGERPGE